jgi:hypothetical protein
MSFTLLEEICVAFGVHAGKLSVLGIILLRVHTVQTGQRHQFCQINKVTRGCYGALSFTMAMNLGSNDRNYGVLVPKLSPGYCPLGLAM